MYPSGTLPTICGTGCGPCSPCCDPSPCGPCYYPCSYPAPKVPLCFLYGHMRFDHRMRLRNRGFYD